MVSCPQCGSNATDIVCENCHHLIRTEDIKNYFDIFSFKNRLSFDQEELDNRFYYLSKKIHPDLHAGKSDEQKQLSSYYSSLLNNGYQVFKNIFKRAKYFLEINNEAELGKEIPKKFLGLVFEVQELLENEQLDSDETLELEDHLEEFEKNISSLKEELTQVFINFDREANTNHTIQEIKRILTEYNYLIRLTNQIDEKIESE